MLVIKGLGTNEQQKYSAVQSSRGCFGFDILSSKPPPILPGLWDMSSRTLDLELSALSIYRICT